MRTLPIVLKTIIAFAIGFPASNIALRAEDAPLKTGEKAPAFKGTGIDGKEISFDPAKLSAKPTLLIFLRGYPGYQCPLCTRQVAEIVKKSADFEQANANVIFVYPGAVKDLTAKANDFLKMSTLPAGMHMIVDRDYALVEQFKLRWIAPNETAYPSTFVINSKGIVNYAKISHSHGDRAPIAEVMSALAAAPSP